MPYSIDDPDEGYVGDPYSTYGWTIYPAAFSQVVEDATGSFINLTGSSFDGLRKVLTQGKPVVCWAALHGFATHSIVITGYDADYIYYNDPWTGEKDAALGIDDFINVWDALGFRALSY
jgi:uncharacterized protein YvpB